MQVLYMRCNLHAALGCSMLLAAHTPACVGSFTQDSMYGSVHTATVLIPSHYCITSHLAIWTSYIKILLLLKNTYTCREGGAWS